MWYFYSCTWWGVEYPRVRVGHALLFIFNRLGDVKSLHSMSIFISVYFTFPTCLIYQSFVILLMVQCRANRGKHFSLLLATDMFRSLVSFFSECKALHMPLIWSYAFGHSLTLCHLFLWRNNLPQVPCSFFFQPILPIRVIVIFLGTATSRTSPLYFASAIASSPIFASSLHSC